MQYEQLQNKKINNIDKIIIDIFYNKPPKTPPFLISEVMMFNKKIPNKAIMKVIKQIESKSVR